MKIIKVQVSIIIIIYLWNSSCAIHNIYDTGREIWELNSMIDEITSNPEYSQSKSSTGLNREIKKQLNVINKQLDRIEKSMHSKLIHDLLNLFPFKIFLHKSVDTFEIFAQSIDEDYKEFRKHIDETDDDAHILNRYMKSIGPYIENKIQMVRKNVIEPNDLLPDYNILVHSITAFACTLQSNICGSGRIFSDILIQLFKVALIAELKAYTMLVTARIHGFPETAGMNVSILEEFQKEFGNYVKEFTSSLHMTDPIYLRACEPEDDIWIRGESFYEFVGTIQTTIFRYHWMKCKFDSCNDIWYKKSRKCEAQYYDSRSGCSGTPSQCVYLNTMEACVLKNGPYKFQYVNSTEFGLLGNNSECSTNNSYLIKDGSSWDYTSSTCACNCYGDENKVSLFAMMSNMKSNMVITSLRFVRRNNILYIQPKQGKLDPDGQISRYSERWISIPTSQFQSVNRENRVFFLDDLQLSSDFVLTGVKFNEVMRRNVSGFAIEIFGVPFDYKSGELNLHPSFLISKRVIDENPGEPHLFKAVSSLHAPTPHLLSPTNKKYVSLKRSDLRADFGQSTLPLFDAVPIPTNPPLPLGGIGIFHKGANGYAGFISLRLYGIKYAQYFMDFRDMYIKNDRVFFNRTK